MGASRRPRMTEFWVALHTFSVELRQQKADRSQWKNACALEQVNKSVSPGRAQERAKQI